MTQPYNTDNESEEFFSENMEDSYINTAHVNFLEAAGARVVPVNYRLRDLQLNKLLTSINGIYIPGDAYHIINNDKYMDTVN